MSCAAACDGAPAAAAAGALVGGASPPAGATLTTRMVPLSGVGGAAVWEQVFWFALPRPAEGGAKLEFELLGSSDKKWVPPWGPECAAAGWGSDTERRGRFRGLAGLSRRKRPDSRRPTP
jgi:hypothetical protein